MEVTFRSNSGYQPTACDHCHSKKIKCDKDDPCGNCRDADATCRRNRPRISRKHRDNPASRLIHSVEQLDSTLAALHSRVQSVEKSISNGETNRPGEESRSSLARLERSYPYPSLARLERSYPYPSQNGRAKAYTPHAPNPEAPIASSRVSLNKRRRSYEHEGIPGVQHNTQGGRSPVSRPYSATLRSVEIPSSAVEAQNMVLQELGNGQTLSQQKRDALKSALSSLRNGMRSESFDHRPLSTKSTTFLSTEDWIVPSLETIQWMLTTTPADAVWLMPDGLPIVTRKTLVEMAVEAQSACQRNEYPALVVCVNSSVSYFLTECILDTDSGTGLEGRLRDKTSSYIMTTQAALNRIDTLSPSLLNLQALVFGVVNAHESGDLFRMWTLTAAASGMCIALNLHRESNPYADTAVDSYSESRYCFFVCYVSDKALAMNLGRPPCLPDAHIQTNLRQLTQPAKLAVRQVLQNFSLELAMAQSCITDLQISKGKASPAAIDAKVRHALSILQVAWNLIQGLPERFASELSEEDLQYEFVLAKYSLNAVKTVLHASWPMSPGLCDLYGRRDLLEAARASLQELDNMRKFSERTGLGSHKINSFAYIVVLYYPFTPYFVLFCSVIIGKDRGDHQLLEGFIQHLVELKESREALERLYKLCLPFHTLASSALGNTAIISQTDTGSAISECRREPAGKGFTFDSGRLPPQGSGLAPSTKDYGVSTATYQMLDQISRINDQQTSIDTSAERGVAHDGNVGGQAAFNGITFQGDSNFENSLFHDGWDMPTMDFFNGMMHEQPFHQWDNAGMYPFGTS